MKKHLLLASIFIGEMVVAQQNEASVGINTGVPQATLDVQGKPNDVSKMDGIIAPRITGDLLNAKTYTDNQKGALVYVVEAASADKQVKQTVNVKDAGYYYFDGNVWVKINTEQAPNNDWQLLGNAGTDAKVNFLGTTDEQALVFKTNNKITGYLGTNTSSKTDRNIAFGEGALSKIQESTSSAYRNVAIGYNALQNVTHSSNNVAIGSYALMNQLTGDNENRKLWGSNVAIGLRALMSSTTGMWNIGIGELALGNLTTGWQNIGIGNRALAGVTTGGRNTALGSEALLTLTTGSDNMAVGLYALRKLQTGTGNQVIGWSAGGVMTEGDYNILFGYNAASSLTSGNRNFIVGNGVNTYTATTSNQLNLGNLIYGVGFLNPSGTQKIGIATGIDKVPTETLHVKGTVRIEDLPANGEMKAIYTQVNGQSSTKKDQPFTAVKTVVVDANGVLGTVDALPTNFSAGAIRTQSLNTVTTQNIDREKLEELYLRNIEQDKLIEIKDIEIKELRSEVKELKSLVQELLNK